MVDVAQANAGFGQAILYGLARKPPQCLIRRKRSSSTAATRVPSLTRQAASVGMKGVEPENVGHPSNPVRMAKQQQPARRLDREELSECYRRSGDAAIGFPTGPSAWSAHQTT